uniref:DUF5681 domain-containing protein n=1 Tax=Ralstonia solanacearum TaxID=305 RepID=A0A0S4UXM7_RALSL|nr:protein of unknown function [Ralstonia solanacearum]
MAKFSSENPGLRFPEGRSANPVGRPRTVDRLRKDVARELVQHGAVLAKMAVRKALEGDAQCLAACVSLLGSAVVEPKRKPSAGGEGKD